MLGVGLGREAGCWVLGRALNTLVRGRRMVHVLTYMCYTEYTGVGGRNVGQGVGCRRSGAIARPVSGARGIDGVHARPLLDFSF